MGKGLPLAEDPVERRSARYVLAPLGELRDNVLGRLVGEAGGVGDSEEVFLLLRGKPVGNGSNTAFSAIPEPVAAPVLHGSPFEAQDVAG